MKWNGKIIKRKNELIYEFGLKDRLYLAWQVIIKTFKIVFKGEIEIEEKKENENTI